MRGLRTLIFLGVALSGCALRIASNTSTGSAAASARVTTASPLATTVVVGVMAADAVHYYTIGPDGKQPMYGAPPPDPTRTINAQDCTQPVDPDAGNLMCR